MNLDRPMTGTTLVIDHNKNFITCILFQDTFPRKLQGEILYCSTTYFYVLLHFPQYILETIFQIKIILNRLSALCNLQTLTKVFIAHLKVLTSIS